MAALLVFGSSFIHTALIADHMAYWVPFGVAFAVVTCGQAVWAALVYRDPLNPRLLVAGAVGNGAVVVVWAISRTAGLPVGPQPGVAEPVGVADSFATLDELMAVVLIGFVLAASRGTRIAVSGSGAARLGSAGPLFIWSILVAFGASTALARAPQVTGRWSMASRRSLAALLCAARSGSPPVARTRRRRLRLHGRDVPSVASRAPASRTCRRGSARAPPWRSWRSRTPRRPCASPAARRRSSRTSRSAIGRFEVTLSSIDGDDVTLRVVRE